MHDLTSFHEIQLRRRFRIARDWLGEPSTEMASEVENGGYLVTYTWPESTPPLSVLTLVGDDGEFVWGVREDDAGPIDPSIGFGIGWHRSAVIGRFPDASGLDTPTAVVYLNDGSLTIVFDGDVVSSIQLLAPLEFLED